MRHAKLALLTVFLASILLAGAETPPTKKVPEITKEELKAKLGSKDLVVIDVRLDEQWRFSNRKIPGAVHENPAAPSNWMDKYPKDKTIVFY
jgi:rhodanese-related sulfurtransferase